MRVCLLKKILPFALTLIVGVSLGSLLKHRHHQVRRCESSESYGTLGGVYEDGRVFVSPAPHTYALEHVSRGVIVLSKPEPLYTDEARRHGTAGEVRLKVLMTEAGKISEIEPLMTLPDGLTERAIEAARRIEFIPAEQNGVPISEVVNISYRFDVK
jgi:TonB family protein